VSGQWEIDIMSEGEHLLVVDDDPEICASLESYFAKNGYKITTLNSGEGMTELSLGDNKDRSSIRN